MERGFENFYLQDKHSILRPRTERSSVAQDVGRKVQSFLAHLRRLLDIYPKEGVPEGVLKVIREEMAIYDPTYLDLRLRQIESLEGVVPVFFGVGGEHKDSLRVAGLPPYEYNPKTTGLIAFSPELSEIPFGLYLRKSLKVGLGHSEIIQMKSNTKSKMRPYLYSDPKIALSFYCTCLSKSDGIVWCFITGGKERVHKQRVVMVPPEKLCT